MQWISDVSAESLEPSQLVTHEPDAATTLVVCSTSNEVAVIGPRPRATYSAGVAATRVKVRLAPGRAQAMLNAPVDDMVDQIVPLRELWGDALVRDVANDPVATLQQVAAHRSATRSSADLVRDGIAHDAAGLLSTLSVRATADHLYVSERYLRDVFTSAVGLSPKRFARVDRVRATLAQATERDWGRIAAELGYYDQAHLTSEFRTAMGVPPAAYAAGERPPATECHA